MTVKNALALFVAERLPKRVVYWTLIQVGIKHCGGPNHPTEVVPEVPFITVLKRYEPHRRFN